MLNESFNVILARTPDIAGEIVTVKDAARGRRALPSWSAGPTRSGCASCPTPCGACACARATRCSWTCAPACCSRSCPAPRWRTCCSRRCPTSPTATSAASTTRSSRSPTPSSCRSCTRSCSPSTGCRRRRASCSTARPGCGKTLIAKAVANSLAQKVADKIGEGKGRSYFINIKGPELLNKYVGETERQIRLVFQRAREKSEEGWPVIVFFDEMDSMFRTRGSGISSDMESTIVPAAAGRDRRRRGPAQRHRDRRHQPGGPDRPGHPAARSPRREDQDRAARTVTPPGRSSPGTSPTEIPLDAEEVGRLGGGDANAAVAR